MKTCIKPYHHGDLRTTLLRAATQILREEGVDALSIRRLADHVGVSRTAPYHHFKDKNALLCAIAEEGFLGQRQTLIEFSKQPLCRELFEAYVLSYIRFASDNSETYDLMYGRNIWKTGQATESLKAVSKDSFKLWIDWMASLQKEAIVPSNMTTLRLGQITWATLHGLCRLLIDGIYLDKTDLEDMAKTAMTLILLQTS